MSAPITLENFNTNFVVRVASYEPDVENDLVKIVFEVKCVLNGRVGVFISDVDTTALPSEYTNEDVLNAAWEDVMDTVNPWASTQIEKEVLSLYVPTSTTDSITLTNFNNNFTVHVSRYELYPQTAPTSWCVGFRATSTASGSVLYVDGTVPIQDFCNNVTCISVATSVWDSLKTRICSWAEGELNKPVLLNTTYVPTDVTV